jgi:predicted anti-sigma-YlaC factor YlaD
MPCESYKDALIEAAASGLEPQSKLRAHLATCPSCRNTYAEEQSLLASLDAGLHKNANAEVPASLLPRVRAYLDENAFQRSWVRNWRALASATAILTIFFLAQAIWRTTVRQQPVETVKKTSTPSHVNSSPQDHTFIAVTPREGNSSPLSRDTIARNGVLQEALAASEIQPQVLVPPDENIILARYAQQWSQRKRAPLIPANSEDTSLSPLNLSPIQIAQLDVKLLAEGKSQ